jgi:hypothetical protein
MKPTFAGSSPKRRIETGKISADHQKKKQPH